MRNLVIKISGLCVVMIALTGCLQKAPQSAKVKSADSGSCDLQRTGSESDELSQKSFKCAYNALFLAGKFSTGETFRELTGFSMAIYDLYQVMFAFEHLFNVYEGYVADGDSGQSSIDDGRTIINNSTRELDKVVKNKVYSCFAKNAKAFSAFLPLYQLSKNNNGDQVSASDVAQFASVVPNLISGLSQMTAGLIDCAVALDGSTKVVSEQVERSVKSLSDALLVVRVVGECGLAIGKGGYMIAQNSMCLADDIKTYYDSRDRLDKQRDNTVNNLPIPQDDQSYTQNGCMEKYGIFLQKQSFWTVSSRARVCADYCGGKSGTSDFYANHYNEVFTREDDRQACGADIGTLATSSGVHSCITFCCDQDNGCVESALSKSN